MECPSRADQRLIQLFSPCSAHIGYIEDDSFALLFSGGVVSHEDYAMTEGTDLLSDEIRQGKPSLLSFAMETYLKLRYISR